MAPAPEPQASSLEETPHDAWTATATSTVPVTHTSRSTFGPGGTVTLATTFCPAAGLETPQEVANVSLAPTVETA